MSLYVKNKYVKSNLNAVAIEILLLFFKIANFSDPNSPLLESFVDDFGIQLWKDCCQAAEKCCQMMLESNDQGIKIF